MNEWMDRVTAAEGLPTFRERRQAEAQWSASIRQMAAEAKGPSFSRSARSERNAKTIVSLMLPAVDKASIAFDRSTEWMHLAQLSLRLAAFHADKGKYPAKLSELRLSTPSAFRTTPSAAPRCITRSKAADTCFTASDRIPRIRASGLTRHGRRGRKRRIRCSYRRRDEPGLRRSVGQTLTDVRGSDTSFRAAPR